jgi:hypothetical protein
MPKRRKRHPRTNPGMSGADRAIIGRLLRCPDCPAEVKFGLGPSGAYTNVAHAPEGPQVPDPKPNVYRVREPQLHRLALPMVMLPAPATEPAEEAS